MKTCMIICMLHVRLAELYECTVPNKLDGECMQSKEFQFSLKHFKLYVHVFKHP